jgi:hypothetical protein
LASAPNSEILEFPLTEIRAGVLNVWTLFVRDAFDNLAF